MIAVGFDGHALAMQLRGCTVATRIHNAAGIDNDEEGRDSRVPPHRRIGPDGGPTVEDIAGWLRVEQESLKTGLLTVVRKHEGDVIG